jgi:hypothetical protein
MSYTRVQAATYLASRYAKLITLVGQTSTAQDAPLGFQLVIDEALRALSVSESDLAAYEVEDGTVKNYLALLRYFALDKFLTDLSISASWSVDGESADDSKVFANVQKLLEAAKSEVQSLGYVVDSAGQFSIGTINLDFLEPDPV